MPEVGDQQPLRMGHARRQLVRRQAAGIAGNHRVVGDQPFQLLIQRVLQLEPFRDRLDKQPGVRYRVQIAGHAQPRQRRFAFAAIKLPDVAQLGQNAARHCRRFLPALRIRFIQQHLMAVANKVGGDAHPHQSGAQYRIVR